MATEINPFIGFLANRGGHSLDAIYAIPHLADDIISIKSQTDYPVATIVPRAAAELSKALKNPVTYIKTRLNQDVFNGARTGNYSDFDKSIAFLRKQNLPETEIQSAVDSSVNYVNSIPQPGQGNSLFDRFGRAVQRVTAPIINPIEKAVSQVSGALAKVEDVVKEDVLTSPAFAIAMAYYMPGLVAQFGPSLATFGVTSAATQAAVANAILSTSIQVAQGVPFDKAFQSAVTNAVVSTGSPAIAKDINKIIENPAVSNAIVSAGASAAKTAASGGSKSDIERNLIAGLVGSGTASATGSAVAGSAVGGGITGGVTGALTGAATTYAAELAAENLAKENAAKKASGSSADPGVKVAGGDDATALNMASISAMPEMLGKSGETASAIYPVVEGGQTFYERTITGKTPDGQDYSYTVTYDPGASAGKQISYTTSGVSLDADGNVIPGSGGGAVATFKRPNFTDYKPTIIAVGGTTPTPKPTPSPAPSPTPSPASEPSPIAAPSDIPPTPSPSRGSSDAGGDITGGTVTGGATGGTSTNVGTGAGSGGTVSDVRGGDGTVGTGTGSGVSGSGTGAGDGSGAGAGSSGTGTGTGGEGDGTGSGEDEKPPVDDKGEPYKPKIFIYGGTKPSTLSQTLGTTVKNLPSASTTTGTSVGLGGRGEIESKESGKKRQTVWNEESLRLKDALGL
jgi:hypothetical protein